MLCLYIIVPAIFDYNKRLILITGIPLRDGTVFINRKPLFGSMQNTNLTRRSLEIVITVNYVMELNGALYYLSQRFSTDGPRNILMGRRKISNK